MIYSQATAGLPSYFVPHTDGSAHNSACADEPSAYADEPKAAMKVTTDRGQRLATLIKNKIIDVPDGDDGPGSIGDAVVCRMAHRRVPRQCGMGHGRNGLPVCRIRCGALQPPRPREVFNILVLDGNSQTVNSK